MKRKPSGFVATCQCGLVTGALDAARTDNKDMGRIMGKWLYDGCTVSPYFSGTMSVEVKRCQCAAGQEGGAA